MSLSKHPNRDLRRRLVAVFATVWLVLLVLLAPTADAQRSSGGAGGKQTSAAQQGAKQAVRQAPSTSASTHRAAAQPPASAKEPKVANAPKASSKTTTGAKPTPQVRAQFNRQTVGATSGVNKALRERAYQRLDQLHAAQGKPIGVQVKSFKNDGRNQTPVLPRATPGGKPIGYTEMRLREGTAGRSYANGRVSLGSDGKAYVSRHHGDPMRGGKPGAGKVVRIQ